MTFLCLISIWIGLQKSKGIDAQALQTPSFDPRLMWSSQFDPRVFEYFILILFQCVCMAHVTLVCVFIGLPATHVSALSWASR